jgi:hypothetical protein
MDDVALRSTESLASSWRTKLTNSVQSLWSGKFWSGEAPAPVTSDGFSLVNVQDGKPVVTDTILAFPKPKSAVIPDEGFSLVNLQGGKAVVTDTVLAVAKPVVYPQEATLARSSEMEPLPAGAHWPSYLEDTYLHFFFVFESTFLSYPLTHVFLLIIALVFQGHFSVFTHLCRSLYTIITFSVSFITLIFLCILGSYINLLYVIWFEYTIFTLIGNLKVQKTYLFLPRLGRLYVFKSEPQVMVYIGLKTDW